MYLKLLRIFIIGFILVFKDVYNRPPQKSKACRMTWAIVKIAVQCCKQSLPISVQRVAKEKNKKNCQAKTTGLQQKIVQFLIKFNGLSPSKSSLFYEQQPITKVDFQERADCETIRGT